MNYNISSIPLFDKQAKRLAKKHPSLKENLAELIEYLATILNKEQHLVITFLKFDWQLSPKQKANQEEQELLPM